ncbi:tRNA-processing ribonuclease BN [Luminiphilus syltensis NOR5-1B]|uniref:UPF0761 membrane protein NOR51B_437 n=1 Tax=Luminiphilus syltensis NOR5-1B TaxID=565045 RepID=B8KQC1_9GAMM|nr:YihY family inner membrane protein [Luminiphilus syltensis]EED34500.1 tRNA-processing ribonuclease BN [Luminiphilus syltensis NOR5-1B]
MTQFNLMIQKAQRGAQYLAARYRDDRCSEIAAALVYMSLFALVPLLTVLFSVASAIPTFSGAENQIQDFLVEKLVPESSTEVADYLTDFSSQAKNLTGVGIGILFVTAVLMLRNIERALNNIWRNSENRGAISSFLLYWAVLSMAPVMMGLVFGVHAFLFAAAKSLADFDVLGVSRLLLPLVPFSLSTLGLSLLYLAVPNSQVPFKHALVGGVFAAGAFSVARVLFTTVMANSSYTLVYGAFAAVPLFLLWLYVTWNIVLMGGIVVHSLSAYQSEEQAGRPLLLKSLDVLFLLWRAQRRGQAMSELQLMRNRDVVVGGLDSESWRTIRDRLMTRKLITQNSRGRYLLARDLHEVPLFRLKEMIDTELDLVAAENSPVAPWQERAYDLLREQRNDQQETLNISLHDLFSIKS